MNIDKYVLFLYVAEIGNISKAAAQLGYTQSGASHTISSLEEEIGVTLFHREHNGVRLTTEGALLMPAIREVIRSNEKVKMTASSFFGGQEGTLRIGAFPSICLTWLPQIIGRYHQHYPKVKVEIVSGDGSYEEMERLVNEGKTDASFVRFPLKNNLAAVALFRDPLRVVLSRDHPLADARKEITLEQLTGEPFLMPTEGNNTDILELFEEMQYTPNVALTMHDDLALLAFAENGLGFTILPELILQGSRHRAAILDLKGDPVRIIGIATRRMEKVPPLLSTFLDTVHQVVPCTLTQRE